MALMRDLSKAQLAFQVADGAPDQFLVSRFRGTEGLCQLYRFEIELASTEEAVAFDDIVGKAAVLSINHDAGTRWFHGIISRFEMTGETHEQTYFRAELVPAVWLLTHRYKSRIFQDMTVKEIITTVLNDGGIPADRFRFVVADGEPRSYCVQYRETDYNFICRLMEEEGIRWYFEQTAEGHLLKMEDDSSAYGPIEGEPQLPYHPPTGMNVETEHVSRFRLGQSVRLGTVVLDDFNFENPKLKLQAKSDSGHDTGLEFADYPGEYVSQGEGGRLAKIRAEEFEAGRTRGVGQSNCSRMSPGRTFDLIEHPSEAQNATYLLTSVTHSGRQSTARTTGGGNGWSGLVDSGVHESLMAARQNTDRTISGLAEALLQIIERLKAGGDPTAHRELTSWLYHAGQVSRDLASTAHASGGNPLEALSIPNLIEDVVGASIADTEAAIYRCRFECIPGSVMYRPPRVTPWPVMRGTQTARVVGKGGEEIETDEYGRVKVQFNWDREGKFDDKSSCWIRVVQGFAGGQYGMMFLPRVGQEVVVDFLEGDPDKPIIIGRVYNADHMPPYKLPDEKTKSVIKTRSSKGGGGSNEIRFEDLKDSEQILLYAQKDLHIRAKHDRVESIEADRHLTVGNSRFEEIKKDYHLKLKEGNKNEEIGGDQSLKVKGKVSVKVDGTHATDVGGDVVEKYGMNYKNEVAMTSATKALAIKLEASTGIELKCGGSSIVLTPAAIFIVGGPLVNINSGSGPPVGPVTAQATAPEPPEEPAAADTVEHGKDTTYAGGEALPPAEAPPDVAGHEFEPEETEEQETTWIDLELLDEEGQPCAGERYIVTDSKGKEHKGSLDANGRAHVIVPQGKCDVTYPDLDSNSWERT